MDFRAFLKAITLALFVVLAASFIMAKTTQAEAQGIIIEGTIDCGEWVNARNQSSAGYFAARRTVFPPAIDDDIGVMDDRPESWLYGD